MSGPHDHIGSLAAGQGQSWVGNSRKITQSLFLSSIMPIRDRVIDLRRVRAADLLGAPWNWRAHPERQRAAVAGSLDELGITEPLKARELGDGRLQLWDGHLRQEIIDQVGPDTL